MFDDHGPARQAINAEAKLVRDNSETAIPGYDHRNPSQRGFNDAFSDAAAADETPGANCRAGRQRDIGELPAAEDALAGAQRGPSHTVGGGFKSPAPDLG